MPGTLDVLDPATLVDRERYPVQDLSHAVARQVIDAGRAQLASIGACELPGFVTPDGVRALVEEGDRLAANAFRSGGIGTAYLEMPDFDRPEGHPRRWLGPYGVGAVAYDLFPRTSPLRRLYEWDPMKDLIEAILDRGPIHRYADPFGALNLAVMVDGEQLQWHFDQADFVVSLAIRPADSGGDFEVAPLIRSAEDEAYDEVAQVLDGTSDRITTLAMTPGTLLIFQGRHSLHRVSPIHGATSRLVGLLAYDTKPGVVGSELLRMNRYGRTEPLPEPPEV